VRAAAAVAAVALLVGCGGDESDRLAIYAASSLTEVFEELAPEHRYNFAGSDELATQLREGADADVYATADYAHAAALAREGLAGRPVVFATNVIVLVVPRDNPAQVERLDHVARRGVRLVIGARGVPIGDYARAGLRAHDLVRALDNVVSEEEDVKGVLAKVRLGEADAGFVYQTDALAAGDDVAMVDAFTHEAQYAVAVVRSTDRRRRAREFVELLRSPRGRTALRRAGFGLP
jgi:molybdate transport system substrate-binding protein